MVDKINNLGIDNGGENHLGEEPKLLGFDYSSFVLDGIDKIEEKERKEKEELQRQKKLQEQENDRKLALLLKHFKELNEKFIKYTAKYPDKIQIIKNIFLNIGVIKTFSIGKKDQRIQNFIDNIIKNIFNFFDTEKSSLFEIYIGKLLNDGELKQLLPVEIYNALHNVKNNGEGKKSPILEINIALFAIKNDFKKLFPILIDESDIKRERDIWDTGGKVR